MIISREHRRALIDFNDSERRDLADMLSHVCRKYDNLFQTHFPYSMGIHQAPLDCEEEEMEASHFHIHFYPPLLRSATVKKFMVGYVLLLLLPLFTGL
jgi:UDPglucose--hexose-1-phosphate uridylyltransferase